MNRGRGGTKVHLRGQVVGRAMGELVDRRRTKDAGAIPARLCRPIEEEYRATAEQPGKETVLLSFLMFASLAFCILPV